MNKVNFTVLIAIIALIVTTAAVGAAGYEPGSTEDPVVTKSYVDAKIAEIKGQEGPQTFAPVFIEAGKKLICGEGTEVILRSGGALVISEGSDGLSDVTEGKDLKEGFAVTKNHLLLVPRDDGRGISAATDIWVMVKGSYSVK
jgi:hypothetical protein